jgi:hypothetical protein
VLDNIDGQSSLTVSLSMVVELLGAESTLWPLMESTEGPNLC